MYWPPSSLPATSRVQSSETPQDAREASSSSGHPASSRTCSSTRRPSRLWTWAWDKACALLLEIYWKHHYSFSFQQLVGIFFFTLICPTVSCPVTSRVWVFWARKKSCILMLMEKKHQTDFSFYVSVAEIRLWRWVLLVTANSDDWTRHVLSV